MNKSSKVGSKLLTALFALLLVMGVGLGGYVGYDWWSSRNAPRDMSGNAIHLEEADIPSPEEVEQMDVKEEARDTTVSASVELKFRAPSVGIDTPVGSMKSVNGMIKPPGFDRAYLIDNIGHPLHENNEGTVYLVMHSVRKGEAPGNRLIDVESAKPRLHKGDEVSLGSYKYRVTGAESVSKSSIVNVGKVWEDVPGKLVIITCLQRPTGYSVKNTIIYAEKI